MALYDFETTVYLGWGHSGEVSTTGTGQIELSDEDVELLVRLMKENRTSEYSKLKLSRRYPKLYNRLRRKYRKLAFETERHHWLIEGLDEGECDYDEENLMEYCLMNGEFTLPDYYYDYEDETDDEKIKEEYLEQALEEFRSWFSDYVKWLDPKDADYILCEVGGVELDFHEYEFCSAYSTELPEAITKLAGLKK